MLRVYVESNTVRRKSYFVTGLEGKEWRKVAEAHSSPFSNQPNSLALSLFVLLNQQEEVPKEEAMRHQDLLRSKVRKQKIHPFCAFNASLNFLCKEQCFWYSHARSAGPATHDVPALSFQLGHKNTSPVYLQRSCSAHNSFPRKLFSSLTNSYLICLPSRTSYKEKKTSVSSPMVL